MQRFRQLMKCRISKESGMNSEICKDWYDLTLVSLLVTYENVTAINARKILLEWHKDSLTEFLHKDPLLEELRILNILFCSPLAKQTKSPMLWQHRRWLLGQRLTTDEIERRSCYIYREATINDIALSVPFSELELRVVIKAGELHPKNYYAWSYARHLVASGVLNSSEELAQRIFNLCKQNVSDISMWSFLDYILDDIGDSCVRCKYIEQVVEFNNIVPGHEALWWFLRSVVKLNDTKSISIESSERLNFDFEKKTIQWISDYMGRR